MMRHRVGILFITLALLLAGFHECFAHDPGHRHPPDEGTLEYATLFLTHSGHGLSEAALRKAVMSDDVALRDNALVYIANQDNLLIRDTLLQIMNDESRFISQRSRVARILAGFDDEEGVNWYVDLCNSVEPESLDLTNPFLDKAVTDGIEVLGSSGNNCFVPHLIQMLKTREMRWVTYRRLLRALEHYTDMSNPLIVEAWVAAARLPYDFLSQPMPHIATQPTQPSERIRQRYLDRGMEVPMRPSPLYNFYLQHIDDTVQRSIENGAVASTEVIEAYAKLASVDHEETQEVRSKALELWLKSTAADGPESTGTSPCFDTLE